ncbi:MAG: hypothetical protein LBT59_25425 [Clostridiales bacterium]|nr:hypothetical protein [Clostridiales bacterium]
MKRLLPLFLIAILFCSCQSKPKLGSSKSYIEVFGDEGAEPDSIWRAFRSGVKFTVRAEGAEMTVPDLSSLVGEDLDDAIEWMAEGDDYVDVDKVFEVEKIKGGWIVSDQDEIDELILEEVESFLAKEIKRANIELDQQSLPQAIDLSVMADGSQYDTALIKNYWAVADSALYDSFASPDYYPNSKVLKAFKEERLERAFDWAGEITEQNAESKRKVDELSELIALYLQTSKDSAYSEAESEISRATQYLETPELMASALAPKVKAVLGIDGEQKSVDDLRGLYQAALRQEKLSSVLGAIALSDDKSMAQAAQSLQEVIDISLKSYAGRYSGSSEEFLEASFSEMDESDFDSSLRYAARKLKSSLSKERAEGLADLAKGDSETLSAYYGFEAASVAAEAMRKSIEGLSDSAEDILKFVALAEASALFNARAEIVLCRMLKLDDSDASESYSRLKAVLDSFVPKWKDYIKAYQRIEPTEEDKNELIKMFNALYYLNGEFDYKNNDILYVLLNLAEYYKDGTRDEVALYFKIWDPDTLAFEDPLSRFFGDYIAVGLPFKETDWVLENLFHTAPDHNAVDEEELYAYEEKYIVRIDDRPYWYRHENEMVQYRPLGNGIYDIAFSTCITNTGTDEVRFASIYATADLQLIDNERRWTFYRISDNPIEH